MTTIGYLGPTGSFSEAATKSLYPEAEHLLQLYPSLDALCPALEKQEIDIMVIPILNSKMGVITDPAGEPYLNSLVKENSSLHIVGEKFLPLNFCLLAKNKVSASKIKTIHVNSYSQKLCASLFAKYPQWLVKVHPSSSAAAAFLNHEKADATHVAIASLEAAQKYNLHILSETILPKNAIPIMQFLAVSHKNKPLTESLDSISAYLLNERGLSFLNKKLGDYPACPHRSLFQP